MNMQQLMLQAQKMQKAMAKAKEELANKSFSVSKGGAFTIVMKGDRTIEKIEIDEDALDKENKEMLEEMIALAIDEVLEKIQEEEAKITQGAAGGLGLGF